MPHIELRDRMLFLARINALSLLLFVSSGWPACIARGAEPESEKTAIVIMEGRQFQPDRTVLHQGQKTNLVFKNRDSELHAVVSSALFAGESLNISGDGAPEFGTGGFKRVLIPADGIAEIHFTPTKSGEYPYLCDMPGHEMKGVIVVE
jgi:plastocyanin